MDTVATTTAAITSRTYQPQQQQRQTYNAFLFCSPDEACLHSRLRQNDPEFTDLQLWLNASSNIGSLTDALEENIVIQDVCLLIHESFGQLLASVGDAEQRMHHYHHHHDVVELFHALGRLPQLQKLYFNTYRFPFVAILPVQAFASAFLGTRQLLEFKLWRTNLYGCGPEDLEAWAQALATGCRSLQTFKLIQCRLVEEGEEEEGLRNDTGTFGTLDPILCALAVLPCLTDVELSASRLSALGTLEPASLSQLLGLSLKLQSFSLMHFDLSEEAVVAIAEALVPQRQQESSKADASTVEETPPPTTIRHVKIRGAGSKVSMFRKPLREAFRRVLERNYVLETLFLFDQRNLQEEIRFYLKLNRLGRNRLFQHNDHEYRGERRDCINANTGGQRNVKNDYRLSHEWIDILAQVQDDLSCLLYFLRECPLLLSSNTSSAYK